MTDASRKLIDIEPEQWRHLLFHPSFIHLIRQRWEVGGGEWEVGGGRSPTATASIDANSKHDDDINHQKDN